MIDKNAILKVERIEVEKIYCPNYGDFRFDRLEEYFEGLKKRPDADLPPIVVVPLPDGRFKIYDGRHRYTAYFMAKRPTIWCIIIVNQKEL